MWLQRAKDQPITYLVFAVIVAIAGFLVVPHLPWGNAEEGIYVIKDNSGSKTIQAGKSFEQKFPSKGGVYNGVVVYALNDTVRGQHFRVRVLDRDKKEIARGSQFNLLYIQPEEHLRLEFPTNTFTTQKSNIYYVQFELIRGPDFTVQTNSKGSLGVTLMQVKPIPFGLEQGTKVGLIFFVATVGIALLRTDRQRWIAVFALICVITPLAWLGFWYSDNALGIADWDYYFSLHENYRQIILQYHSFPFWNPYTCGGTAGLGDPEFPVFRPTFLLELLLGIPAGLRVVIFVSLAILGSGMLALSKRLGLSPLAALVVALGVAFSSVSRLELVEGHVNQFSLMWLAWAFWAWVGAYQVMEKQTENGLQKKWWHMYALNRSTLLCAVFLALTFYSGGIYLLLYTATVFLVLPWLVHRPWRAIRITAMAAIWALALAALKLLPVLYWLHEFRSRRYASSAYSLPYLWDIFFGRHLHGEYLIFRQNTGWQEYGAYIGYGIAILAAVAVVVHWRLRIVRGLAIGAVLAIAISTTGPILKPFFDHMTFFPRSTISREIVLAVASLSLLAGIGFDELRRRTKIALPVAAMIVGLIGVDLISLDYQLSEQAFILPNVYPSVSPAPSPIAFTTQKFTVGGGDLRATRTYAATIAGYGTTAYCSVLGPIANVQTIYDGGGGKIASLEDARATYQLVRWSPNEISFLVSSPVVTKIIVNTNYAEGWQVNGQPAIEAANLVSSIVPAGENQLFVFSYHPIGYPAGLIITLGTLLLLIGFFLLRL